MKVGFTGTRAGMSRSQLRAFRDLIAMLDLTEFHHGDCIGADATAHHVVLPTGAAIHIHPPEKKGARAFCVGATQTYEEAPYLERNQNIVLYTDMLIATPKEDTEIVRSGTWATIRYARKLHRPIYIIFPIGNTVTERI